MLEAIRPGPVIHVSEQPTIRVVLGTQYGQQIVKPASPEAETFCELCGVKTLTPRMIQLIKKLGYRVEVIPTEPKEL